MTEKGAVIEIEFGVERYHIIVFGDDKGVNLGQRAVFADKGVIQAHHEVGDFADGGLREVHGVSHAGSLEGSKPNHGVDIFFDYLVGHFRRDFFNLHAAFFGAHHNDLRRLAVNDEREIIFFFDFRAFFDEEATDFFTFGAGLVGDEGFAEELFGVGFHVADIFGEFDAAGFTASAGMNLCLDHDNIGADFFGIFDGFFHAESRKSLGYVDPVRLQNLLALVFVNIHIQSSFRLNFANMGNLELQCTTSPRMGQNPAYCFYQSFTFFSASLASLAC